MVIANTHRETILVRFSVEADKYDSTTDVFCRLDAERDELPQKAHNEKRITMKIDGFKVMGVVREDMPL